MASWHTSQLRAHQYYQVDDLDLFQPNRRWNTEERFGRNGSDCGTHYIGAWNARYAQYKYYCPRYKCRGKGHSIDHQEESLSPKMTLHIRRVATCEERRHIHI